MGQIKSLTLRGMYKKEAYTKLNHVSQKIRKKQRPRNPVTRLCLSIINPNTS
ncbi:hypothetical protein K250101E9_52720 [Enterocloster aldenensis]